MIAYLSPSFGIPLCIVLIVVGILLLVRAYRNRGKHFETKSQQTGISVIEMLGGVHAHKCSRCGFGVRVGIFNRIATYPKCGNVDNIK